MDYVEIYGKLIQGQLQLLQEKGVIPKTLKLQNITVAVPSLEEHGDLSTNAAFVISKQLGKSPSEVAELLMPALRSIKKVATVSYVKPGFINLKLLPQFWFSLLKDVSEKQDDYGSCNLGQGLKVNMEYVSANPTGPLHVAHLRGGVYGDVLANAMQKCGYDVTKEYYLNDRGTQVEQMAKSVYHRYLELYGANDGDIKPGMYPGKYLIPIAEMIKEKDGDKWLTAEEKAWLPYFVDQSIASTVETIKQDLHQIGIHHDVFRSERDLHSEGDIFQKSIESLQEQGLLYKGTLNPPKTAKVSEWKPREQLLFRSTFYGDDEDRALTKSNGDWTYLASDIAYAYDKISRGFKLLFYVLGADHHSYVKPIESLALALSKEDCRAEIPLCQMVHLRSGEKSLKLSKRSGTIYTLKELAEEIGKDAARMIMLIRSHTLQIEFDLSVLKEQSKNNPVFYLHYAYARCCSVRRIANAAFPGLQQAEIDKADYSLLTNQEEISLLRTIGQWPSILKSSVNKREPHLITFYLKDLAANWHSFWTKGKRNPALRMVHEKNRPLSIAHLALASAVAYTLASGMKILGLETPETM